MNTGPITQTIEQAFFAIIAALGRFVGSRRDTRTKWSTPIEPLPVPLIVAVWSRLMDLNRRFQALMVQIRAGTLPKPRVRGPQEAARRKARRAELAAMDPPPPPRPPPRRGLPLAYGPMAPLPRDFGYVLRLVPWHAAPLANQMRILLETPEMAAIIAATPQLQRVLRQLCHMLGITTEGLIPPPPPSPATAGEAADKPAGPVRPALPPAALSELRAAGPPMGQSPARA